MESIRLIGVSNRCARNYCLVPELWLDRKIRVAPIRRILTVCLLLYFSGSFRLRHPSCGIDTVDWCVELFSSETSVL